MSTSMTNSNSAMGAVLSLVVKEGWLDDGANDLCSMERTCRAAKDVWCSDEDTWKYLAIRQWPHLIEECGNDGGSSVKWKSFFSDPRLWLEASAAQIKAKQKWSEAIHYGVKCGHCGCRCEDSDCIHSHIESKFRYDRTSPKEWPFHREWHDDEETPMIYINCFCEPCFERLVEKEIVKHDDYTKKEKETLFNTVVNEIVQAKTEQFWDEYFQKQGRQRRGSFYVGYEGFFKIYEGYIDWQKAHEVDADEVGVVVAYALVQEGCKTRYLKLDGLHYNDPGLGRRGYKALAFALSINTSVERIDFFQDFGKGCCGDYGELSYAADYSDGLFLKALKHNKASCLTQLPNLCPSAFGPLTMDAWEKAKPGLVCGPKLYLDCYEDVEYVSSSDGEDEEL